MGILKFFRRSRPTELDYLTFLNLNRQTIEDIESFVNFRYQARKSEERKYYSRKLHFTRDDYKNEEAILEDLTKSINIQLAKDYRISLSRDVIETIVGSLKTGIGVSGVIHLGYAA